MFTLAFVEKPAASTIRPQLRAFFLSASRSGRFDLPVQTVSTRCSLTGKLTGEPLDNHGFSTTPVGAERGGRARNRQPQTTMDGVCRWRASEPPAPPVPSGLALPLVSWLAPFFLLPTLQQS